MKITITLLFILMMTENLYTQQFEHFITATGNKLIDGDKEYRFLSYNIPNLNFVEDEMAFTTVHPYRLPTEFEIRDALLSIKQMGGRVVRIYTLPVKRSDEPADVPATVLGPGKFNEEAFKINDLMLSIANEVGIRIIFPFVNNWKWMGGRPQYAEFRGKTEEEFWTDPQLIEDVKKTIEYTINRTNTITGKKYKDDKAILCWETGNELTCPPEWTSIITRYIKSLDKNHLVMDGYSGPIRKESIEESSIDIVNTHHYETSPDETIKCIKQNLVLIAGQKPYIIGEFGFQSTTALGYVMDWMISNKDIAAALVWSLRSHREEGGFYWHSEPFGYGLYKAYHWPGFESGHAYDEKAFVDLMRNKAFNIQGIPVPPLEKPTSSKLLPIKEVYYINWQGSAGASFYNIERSENVNGPWEKLAVFVNDAAVQYAPLYHDKNAEIGKTYYYRVIAGNGAGLTDPSNIVGPVHVKTQALIDDMSNYGVLYDQKDIKVETGDDRKFKEDFFRLAGKNSSELIYHVPGTFAGLKVYSFQNSGNAVLTFEQSFDGKDFQKINARNKDYFQGKNDYESWHPVLYEAEGNENTKFIKILFHDIAQISRIEVIYR